MKEKIELAQQLYTAFSDGKDVFQIIKSLKFPLAEILIYDPITLSHPNYNKTYYTNLYCRFILEGNCIFINKISNAIKDKKYELLWNKTIINEWYPDTRQRQENKKKQTHNFITVNLGNNAEGLGIYQLLVTGLSFDQKLNFILKSPVTSFAAEFHELENKFYSAEYTIFINVLRNFTKYASVDLLSNLDGFMQLIPLLAIAEFEYEDYFEACLKAIDLDFNKLCKIMETPYYFKSENNPQNSQIYVDTYDVKLAILNFWLTRNTLNYHDFIKLADIFNLLNVRMRKSIHTKNNQRADIENAIIQKEASIPNQILKKLHLQTGFDLYQLILYLKSDIFNGNASETIHEWITSHQAHSQFEEAIPFILFSESYDELKTIAALLITKNRYQKLCEETREGTLTDLFIWKKAILNELMENISSKKYLSAKLKTQTRLQSPPTERSLEIHYNLVHSIFRKIFNVNIFNALSKGQLNDNRGINLIKWISPDPNHATENRQIIRHMFMEFVSDFQNITRDHLITLFSTAIIFGLKTSDLMFVCKNLRVEINDKEQEQMQRTKLYESLNNEGIKLTDRILSDVTANEKMHLLSEINLLSFKYFIVLVYPDCTFTQLIKTEEQKTTNNPFAGHDKKLHNSTMSSEPKMDDNPAQSQHQVEISNNNCSDKSRKSNLRPGPQSKPHNNPSSMH